MFGPSAIMKLSIPAVNFMSVGGAEINRVVSRLRALPLTLLSAFMILGGGDE